LGLFSRRRVGERGPVTPSKPLQVPDELARDAGGRLDAGDFTAALELYAQAIDKLHTMCVIAQRGSRLRDPSEADQPILDGFTTALTAVQGTLGRPRIDQRIIMNATGYLQQIAVEAQEMGLSPERYVSAIHAIEASQSDDAETK
jgi:hypothetical protein